MLLRVGFNDAVPGTIGITVALGLFVDYSANLGEIITLIMVCQ